MTPRDREVDELRRRVAYLEGLVATMGVKQEADADLRLSDTGEEKKQDDTIGNSATASAECITALTVEGKNDSTVDHARPPMEDAETAGMTGKTSNDDSNAKPSEAFQGNDTSKGGDYHPPGTQPGGTWYKQTFKGTRTQTASNLACCFFGCPGSYLVSQIAMDERLVYFDRNGSQKYHDAFGQLVLGVISPGSTLSEIPPEMAKGAIKRGQVPPPLAKPEPKPETKSTAPPGLPEGGLYYKQYIRGGQTRLIYRPNPMGMEFYDLNGETVNLFDGPVVPPVTMVSLL